MVIVSTDSGLERTGWALFTEQDGQIGLSKYGCIFTDKNKDIQTRLLEISYAFRDILSTYHPEAVIFEQLFYNLNKKTAIAVAQTQGILLALCKEYNAEVVFFTPSQIKQTITGDGAADKKQVEKMVQIELQMEKMPKPDDVVDAIAAGMAYLYRKRTQLL